MVGINVRPTKRIRSCFARSGFTRIILVPARHVPSESAVERGDSSEKYDAL